MDRHTPCLTPPHLVLKTRPPRHPEQRARRTPHRRKPSLPAHPTPLTQATTGLDNQAIRVPSDTLTDLIAAREPYYLKLKQGPDPHGALRLQCPSPAVTCPRRNRLHPQQIHHTGRREPAHLRSLGTNPPTSRARPRHHRRAARPGTNSHPADHSSHPTTRSRPVNTTERDLVKRTQAISRTALGGAEGI